MDADRGSAYAHVPVNGSLLASIVDLERYPIDRIESDAYGSLVSRCRADLVTTGAAQLPGFLRPQALTALRAEALAAAPHGFPNDARANVYFTDEDTSLPPTHPNRRPVRSAQKAVAMDLLPDSFGTKVVYRSEELTRFAADVLGAAKLYPSADSLDGCNMTVYEEGDELGWHFDNSEFSITLMIQQAERGGLFEYVPFTRTEDDEQLERVNAILDGDRTGVLVIDPQPGELSIFRGRYSLHRVSQVGGATPRCNSVLTYATRPDHRLSTLTAELFYGRASGD
jgi:hypothetical protein